MDIEVVAVGRLKAGAERDLCSRYLERAERTGARMGFRGFAVKELAESRAGRVEDRLAEERKALQRKIGEGARIVCLDRNGDLISSEALAQALRADAEAALPSASFVIGGPDGLSPDFLKAADRCISFGRVTFPHQLARVLLAEQLYRAMSILSGHPYHRA